MPNPSADNRGPEELLLEQCAGKLIEHFDTVRIFVTKRGEATTSGPTSESHSIGLGCIFTQVGQISEWLVRNDERTRMSVRQEFLR